MPIAVAIALIVVLDVLLVLGLAYVMSRPSKLRPHWSRLGRRARDRQERRHAARESERPASALQAITSEGPKSP